MGLSIKTVSLFSYHHWSVKRLYKSAFPPEERLPYLSLLANAWTGLGRFEAYYDGRTFVGFTYTLTGQMLDFLFFLAVETSLRSKGYGGQMVRLIREKAGAKPVLLAIEPLETRASNYSQRQHRLRFYQKNGWQLTDTFYHEGSERYQLMTTQPLPSYKPLQELMDNYCLKGVAVSLSK